MVSVNTSSSEKLPEAVRGLDLRAANDSLLVGGDLSVLVGGDLLVLVGGESLEAMAVMGRSLLGMDVGDCEVGDTLELSAVLGPTC